MSMSDKEKAWMRKIIEEAVETGKSEVEFLADVLWTKREEVRELFREVVKERRRQISAHEDPTS
jgi:hypothetical protein